MPNKKLIIPSEPEEHVEDNSTAVALISPQFTTPTVFKLPNVEESLVIIKNKRKDNEALIIDGVDDKDGYTAVKAAMAQMKDDRIAFVNAATENVIIPVSDYLSDFKKDLETIVTEFKAGEKEQRDKKDFIDNEKIRLKAEEEARKVEAMQLRVSELNALGAVFDGKIYTFQYNEMLMITAIDVKDFYDEKFNDFISLVRTEHSAELVRIAEAAKLKEQQEKEAEDLANQVIAQAEANKAAQDALNIKQRKLRIKELNLLGAGFFNEDEEGYIVNGHTLVLLTTIDTATDEEWEMIIEGIENHVAPEPDAIVEEIVTDNNEESVNEFKSALSSSDVVYGFPTPVISISQPITTSVQHSLYFSLTEPYSDFDLTLKLKIRLYPDQYSEQAMIGVERVGNSGIVQGLNWALISKP